MRKELSITIFLICFLSSCLTNRSKPVISDDKPDSQKVSNSAIQINLDSISKLILKENVSRSDTLVYEFSIEDLSTEGAGGVAFYVDSKLVKLEFEAYTSMYKTYLLYNFNLKNIKVSEKIFNIHENLRQEKELIYLIDYNGIPIERVDSSRVDVFKVIKDNVPFKL